MKIATRPQVALGGVAQIVATDEKAVEPLGNLVDALLQLFRPEIRAVAEDAALGVVAGLDKFHRLPSRQDFGSPHAQTAQIRLRHKSRPFIPCDEFLDGVLSIACDGGKTFLRDGKDASAPLIGQAIVEHAGFVRAGSVTLDEQWSDGAAQIFRRLLHRADQFHPHTTLADVGFQNERKVEAMPGTKLMQ